MNIKKKRRTNIIGFKKMADFSGSFHKKAVWSIHKNKGHASTVDGASWVKKSKSLSLGVDVINNEAKVFSVSKSAPLFREGDSVDNLSFNQSELVDINRKNNRLWGQFRL